MWLFKVIKELRIWFKIRNIAKESVKTLNEKGFRVDWVGRIYTVINIPDEVLSSAVTNESFVYMKLQELSPVFLDIGIADYVSPEIMEIPDTGSYLLIISADRNYFRLFEFVKFLFKLFLSFVIIRIVYIIFTLEPILNFLNNIFKLIINGN